MSAQAFPRVSPPLSGNSIVPSCQRDAPVWDKQSLVWTSLPSCVASSIPSYSTSIRVCLAPFDQEYNLPQLSSRCPCFRQAFLRLAQAFFIVWHEDALVWWNGCFAADEHPLTWPKQSPLCERKAFVLGMSTPFSSTSSLPCLATWLSAFARRTWLSAASIPLCRTNIPACLATLTGNIIVPSCQGDAFAWDKHSLVCRSTPCCVASSIPSYTQAFPSVWSPWAGI